nr:hypothetical protein [Myxococcus sp. RHSTA-1-4]
MPIVAVAPIEGHEISNPPGFEDVGLALNEPEHPVPVAREVGLQGSGGGREHPEGRGVDVVEAGGASVDVPAVGDQPRREQTGLLDVESLDALSLEEQFVAAHRVLLVEELKPRDLGADDLELWARHVHEVAVGGVGTGEHAEALHVRGLHREGLGPVIEPPRIAREARGRVDDDEGRGIGAFNAVLAEERPPGITAVGGTEKPVAPSQEDK